ncbi:MAG: fumarylacetoacetate hydrolase family protein, partial [Clostridiales bacterium]|nr:fumarylacetoacetate hydrolase family protein [Clostridiales bacterium]
GVNRGDGLIDITALGFPSEMNEIIKDGEMLKKIRASIEKAAPIDGADIRFGNITDPAKIVCVGLNFTDHAEETGGAAPKYPVFFSKFNDALHPAGEPVALPPWQRSFDYEAELVIVVGKSSYNVSEEDAFEHIFGFACGNDLSARDSQFLSSQWLAGKSFPCSAPAGPHIVTRDELDPDNQAIGIECYRNGEKVQSGSTGNMIFSCRQLLSWASRFFALSPGDLIFTGTPGGVILGKPKGSREWLRAGETVSVEIEGVGALVTPLV